MCVHHECLKGVFHPPSQSFCSPSVLSSKAVCNYIQFFMSCGMRATAHKNWCWFVSKTTSLFLFFSESIAELSLSTKTLKKTTFVIYINIYLVKVVEVINECNFVFGRAWNGLLTLLSSNSFSTEFPAVISKYAAAVSSSLFQWAESQAPECHKHPAVESSLALHRALSKPTANAGSR